MNRCATRLWISVLALVGAAAAGAATAPADEVVYGRSQTDGSVSLTNVPDSDGYEVMASGPAGAASPGSPASRAYLPRAPGRPGIPVMLPPAAPVAELSSDDAMGKPPTSPQESLPSREALQDAAVAAARSQAQSPEVMQAAAGATAGQAFQDMTAAGGSSERLKAMYQASQEAFAQQRARAQSGH